MSAIFKMAVKTGHKKWAVKIQHYVKKDRKRRKIIAITRKNCFRYLKLTSPLNAAICTTTYLERQKCYGLGKKILFKKQLFDLEVKGQGTLTFDLKFK
jgi:hypothetical protein